MAIVQVTQANGNPALVNAEAVTHVITPPTESTPTGARAIIYFSSGQQLATRETVVEIKDLL